MDQQKLIEHLRKTRNTEGRMNLVGQHKPLKLVALEVAVDAAWNSNLNALDIYEACPCDGHLAAMCENRDFANLLDTHLREAIADFTANPSRWWDEEMAEQERLDQAALREDM